MVRLPRLLTPLPPPPPPPHTHRQPREADHEAQQSLLSRFQGTANKTAAITYYFCLRLSVFICGFRASSYETRTPRLGRTRLRVVSYSESAECYLNPHAPNYHSAMAKTISGLRWPLLTVLLLTACWPAATLVAEPPATDEPAPLPGQLFGEESDFTDSSRRVSTSIIPSWGGTTVAPGSDLIAAVVFDHNENWHIHTHNPQVPEELGSADLYIATAIAASTSNQAPLTTHGAAIQWPDPKTIDVAFLGDPVRYAVYAGRAVAYVPITVEQDAEPGTYPVTFSLTYQACDDTTCIAPVRGQTITVEVEVGTMETAAAYTLAPERVERLQKEFAGFDASVWPKLRSGRASQVISIPFIGNHDLSSVSPGAYAAMMLGIAFLGGAILNLTPCVLPVIPLKVMALANAAGSRRRTLFLGIVMAIGLLGFWLVIGGMITGLKQFQAVNQLFQNAGFTIGVGVFILVMGIGMLGVFPINLPRWVYTINPTQETVSGSLLYGVMTAILATPCAGPFMGFAVAWATQVSPIMTLGIFGCVGLGMASPYLLLSAYPQLTHKLPRTGPGSELLKQVMGLLMIAAAAFFLGSGLNAAATDGSQASWKAYWWAVGGVLAIAGLWLAYGVIRISRRGGPRFAAALVGLVMVFSGVALGGGLSGTFRPSKIDWVYYTPERFQQEIDAGNVVVMDFTADWCINCKVLEQNVLEDDRVADLLDEQGIVPMKVDITSSGNEAGNEMLAEMSYSTIPLLVVFEPTGDIVFKNDFYRVVQVVQAIERAKRVRR